MGPKDLIRRARRAAVLTGAGISAESGIPTFRGPQGLWRQFRPEDLATPEALSRDPKLVWEWYESRRQVMAKAEPNAAHLALAELQRRTRLTLITQNIDGLHARAGSKDVLEFHGSIWRLRCTVCSFSAVDERVPLPELPPYCACGHLLRPDIVLFGEMIPPDIAHQSFRAARSCDLMLVVGTSAVVYPAASLVHAALEEGTPVIEINVEPTDLSSQTLFLQGPAATILPELIQKTGPSNV
jgi:NAD-dependent deacetylase